MQNIRTKSSDVSNHRQVFECAQVTWHLHQLQCILEGYVLDELSLAKRSKLRFLTAIVIWVFTKLNIGTKSSQFNVNVFLSLWVNTKLAAFILYGRAFYFFSFDNKLVEWFIKSIHHLLPLQLTVSYLIKFLFDLSCERVICYFFKMLHQKISYDHRNVGGKQFVFLRPCDFRFRFSSDLVFF